MACFFPWMGIADIRFGCRKRRSFHKTDVVTTYAISRVIIARFYDSDVSGHTSATLVKKRSRTALPRNRLASEIRSLGRCARSCCRPPRKKRKVGGNHLARHKHAQGKGKGNPRNSDRAGGEALGIGTSFQGKGRTEWTSEGREGKGQRCVYSREEDTYAAFTDAQGFDAPFILYGRFERFEPRIVEVA